MSTGTSVSIVKGVPNNGALVEEEFITNAHGDTLRFAVAPKTATAAVGHPWLYQGHTPYQAAILKKGETVPTTYTYLSTALAAFKALTP